MKKLYRECIRFLVSILIFFPLYKFRYYLFREGMVWEYVDLYVTGIVGVIYFILSKPITNFIISNYFPKLKKDNRKIKNYSSKKIKELFIILFCFSFVMYIQYESTKKSIQLQKEKIEINKILNETAKTYLSIQKTKSKIDNQINESKRKLDSISTLLHFSTNTTDKVDTLLEVIKEVDKTADYYYNLADNRLKSKEHLMDGMNSKDFIYQVENTTLCIDLDPNYWQAYIIRGNAYYELGKYRKSMYDFKKAKKYSPKDFMWVIYTGIGNAKLKLKLNYCREYKKACDLGYCDPYYDLCK